MANFEEKSDFLDLDKKVVWFKKHVNINSAAEYCKVFISALKASQFALLCIYKSLKQYSGNKINALNV